MEEACWETGGQGDAASAMRLPSSFFSHFQGPERCSSDLEECPLLVGSQDRVK